MSPPPEFDGHVTSGKSLPYGAFNRKGLPGNVAFDNFNLGGLFPSADHVMILLKFLLSNFEKSHMYMNE